MSYKNNNVCGHIHVSVSREETAEMLCAMPVDPEQHSSRKNNLSAIISPKRKDGHHDTICLYCNDTGFIKNFLRTPMVSFACPKCLHGAFNESLFFANNLTCDHEGNPICEETFIKSLRCDERDVFKKFNILFGKTLFVELKGVGASDKGISSDFMHFKAGTNHFEIYRWIEKNFPPFSFSKTIGLDPMPYA